MWPPQKGTIATCVATGTSATDQMLHARMDNTIVLLEGALVAENEIDRAVVGKIKGLGLNLAALP